MAIRLEITCIAKTDRTDPHERIQTVGGHGFRYSQPDAIRRIEDGTNEFWTKGGGKIAKVIVAAHDDRKYLKTTNDGVHPDNLLALPTCR